MREKEDLKRGRRRRRREDRKDLLERGEHICGTRRGHDILISLFGTGGSWGRARMSAFLISDLDILDILRDI